MDWLSLGLKLLILILIVPVLAHVNKRTLKHQADFEAFLAEEKAAKETESLRDRTHPNDKNDEKLY